MLVIFHITSYLQKHKLELTIRFLGCFPHGKKKKSFQALSELSKDDYVDKHGVCYLKTDQSILHILKRESVIKKNPG